ncbi:hypothetical protein GI482_06360 [Bacillus sp. N3536]|nr:hypothetical protein GI482_06360 [Bacillus sp. N3536]
MKALIIQVLYLLLPIVVGLFVVQMFIEFSSWSYLEYGVLIALFALNYMIIKKIICLKINNLLMTNFFFVGTLLFSIFIGGSIWLNYAEEAYQEITPSSKITNTGEKEIGSIFHIFFNSLIQKDIEKKKIANISYYFAEENIASVNEYSSLLEKEKAKLDLIFGNEVKDPLSIEIYNDPAAIKEISPGAVGYYKRMDQSIHLMKMDEEKRWERILLHEYTHYRIHQFAKINGLSSKMEHLPFWFIEGLSEYVGYQDRVIDPNILSETVDYRLIDTNKTIPSKLEHYKVYLQGYFTVKKLDSLYGTEVLTELLLSKSLDDFYKNFEKTTGKSTIDFQQTLLVNL